MSEAEKTLRGRVEEIMLLISPLLLPGGGGGERGVGVSGGRKSIKKCVSVGGGIFFPITLAPPLPGVHL